MLSAFFYGYIVTQLPGGWLATRFGGKWVFGIGVLGTAVLTLLTPLAARRYDALIFLRVVEGLMEVRARMTCAFHILSTARRLCPSPPCTPVCAVTHHCTYVELLIPASVWAKWAPPQEKTFLATFAQSGLMHTRLTPYGVPTM